MFDGISFMAEIIIRTAYELVFAYCAFSVVYLFILSLWGRLFYRRQRPSSGGAPTRSVALLVPAYKEDGIILSTAENLLALDYPRDLFDVYIIADGFREETLASLRSLRVYTM